MHTHLLVQHTRTQVVAILCLSLAASYHFSASIACPGDPQNHTLTVETNYPFHDWVLRNVTIVKIDNPTPAPILASNNGQFSNVLISQGAQLFVVWSVATMFYCVAAVLVYMVVTANEGLERVMDLLVYAVSGYNYTVFNI